MIEDDMTVEKLIELLKEYPPKAVVQITVAQYMDGDIDLINPSPRLDGNTVVL